MFTNYYVKKNNCVYNPSLKSYLKQYSTIIPYYNFLKTNSENTYNKNQFFHFIQNTSNLLQENDEDNEHNEQNTEYTITSCIPYTNPFNPFNPFNTRLYFILGSAIIGLSSYSYYHFFYQKK